MSFPRYPEYKDSGVEWLGEVPAHWEVMRLKDDLDFVTSGSRGWADNYSDTGDVFIRIANLTRDSIRLNLADVQRVIVPEGVEGSRTRVQYGDVIFSITAYLGSVAVVPNLDQSAYVSQHVALARLRSRHFQPSWVGFSALSIVGKTWFDMQSYGGTKIQLSLEDIRELPVLRPPTSEQESVITFLDRETAKIDSLIAEQQRLVELLKEKRQAVISHAVTKGLNPDAPMKPSGVEWLGDVPAHWEIKRLKHVSPFMTVGVVVNPSAYVSDEGLPFIYGGDIREGEIDWANARRIDVTSSEENAKTRLEPGDLLTVRVGAPGVTAVVPAECAGGNCASVMLLRRGAFNSHWLCFVMNTRIVRFQVEVVQYGAAQEQFNISHAVNFWMPVPPRHEQDEIVDYVVHFVSEIDTLTAEAERAIALLQERRTALISAAVTGQIDVRGGTA